jgi:preprotein translocase subunit SecA
VARAQKQIEGNNYDRRKTVMQYDEVLRKQRDVIYEQRTDVLFLETIEPTVLDMIRNTLFGVVDAHQENMADLPKALHSYFPKDVVDEAILKTEEDKKSYLWDVVEKELEDKKQKAGEKSYNDFLKAVTLRVVDTHWMQHIDGMSELRQAVGLQSYAQQNPFREYQDIGYQMFQSMIQSIQSDVTKYVLKAQVRQNTKRVQVQKPIFTSSGKTNESKKKKPVHVKKVGRNDPCPCGSGKKYKHCHGRNE